MESPVIKLDEFQAAVGTYCESFQRMPILSDQQDANVGEAATKIKGLKKSIEEKHALLVGPYKEITKALDARKKALVDPMEDLLDWIRKARGQWAAHKAEEAVKEKQRLEALRQQELEKKNREEEAARALGIEDASPVLDYAKKDQELQIQQAVVEKAAKTKGLRMVWKFEVTSPAEVPRQYLVPDESAIRKAVNSGAKIIPGVKIWEEPYVAIR